MLAGQAALALVTTACACLNPAYMQVYDLESQERHKESDQGRPIPTSARFDAGGALIAYNKGGRRDVPRRTGARATLSGLGLGPICQDYCGSSLSNSSYTPVACAGCPPNS